MPWQAYIWRLGQNVLEDSAHYTHRPGISAKKVAKLHDKLVLKHVPKRFRSNGTSTEDSIPTAYLIVKSKCIDKATGHLSCPRQHARQREIIAYHKEHQKRFMQLAARAIRLAKKHSQDPCWTLWNQADVSKEIDRRVARLSRPTCCESKCPCGLTKRKLEWAKADASQFFKDASSQRGRTRARILLQRIERSLGKNAVVVIKGRKAGGFLCKGSIRHSHRYQVVKFSEMLEALEFAATDSLFRVGEETFQSSMGLPMGGSMSEPTTLIDLGEDVYQFRKLGSKQAHCSFGLPGYSIEDLLQGLLYVDDCFTCFRCLLR